jgi:hypothetical protein
MRQAELSQGRGIPWLALQQLACLSQRLLVLAALAQHHHQHAPRLRRIGIAGHEARQHVGRRPQLLAAAQHLSECGHDVFCVRRELPRPL